MTPRLARKLLAVRRELVNEHAKAKSAFEADPVKDYIECATEFDEYLQSVKGEDRFLPANMAKVDAIDKRRKAAHKRMDSYDGMREQDAMMEAEFLLNYFDQAFFFERLEEAAKKWKALS